MSDFDIVCVTGGPFEENSYLIADKATGNGAIVDPGWGADEDWKPVLDKRGVKLEKILCTHGHIDHVSGVAALLRLYPGTPVLIHQIDEPLMSEGNLKTAKYFGLPYEPATATGHLTESAPVSVGNIVFDVLFVPGHCPGHVVFLHDKTLFGGDVLFAGSIGRTDLPGGNFHELSQSIVEKILPLGDDITVYPGHGPTTTIGEERATNPFVLQMLEERTTK